MGKLFAFSAFANRFHYNRLLHLLEPLNSMRERKQRARCNCFATWLHHHSMHFDSVYSDFEERNENYWQSTQWQMQEMIIKRSKKWYFRVKTNQLVSKNWRKPPSHKLDIFLSSVETHIHTIVYWLVDWRSQLQTNERMKERKRFFHHLRHEFNDWFFISNHLVGPYGVHSGNLRTVANDAHEGFGIDDAWQKHFCARKMWWLLLRFNVYERH